MRKSYSNNMSGLLCAVVMLFGSATASATTTFPALELNPVAVTGTSSGLNMSGSAPYLLSDASTILFDLVPDLPFTLTSDATGSGTLLVDGGSALSATFSNLAIVHIAGGAVDWNADLTYTGGSLVSGLTTGRVEGSFAGIGGFGFGQSLLGEDFTGSNGIAKVGAVVPVPAAVWLFGSGLLGLAGIVRRRAQA